MTSRPTPAAARYCSTAQPSPPAPTTSTAAAPRRRLAGGAHFRQHTLAAIAIDSWVSSARYAAAATASHCRVRSSGCAARTMSVTTAATSAPAANTPARRSSVSPPMATSGTRPHAPLPFADARQSLRLPRHHFQQGRVDRTERHVVRRERQRSLELALIVRADAETYAGTAQRRHIGAIEVALPEVHEVAARLEREPPVIVHDELHAGTRRSSRGRRGSARAPPPAAAP